MKSPDTTLADLNSKGFTPRGGGSSTPVQASIRYVGAKEPRVPMPYVIVGAVLVAGAIAAAKYFISN